MTIYTDSLCSLHLLNRLIYEPQTILESKHLALLQSLQVVLSQRICHGAITHFYKVRSHSGIPGNEEADTLAKQAATHPTTVHIHDTTGETSHTHHCWPTIQPTTLPNGALPPRRPASNLCRDIKNNLPLSLHVSPKYLTGIYATMWLQTYPLILPQVSNHFWTTPTVPGPSKCRCTGPDGANSGIRSWPTDGRCHMQLTPTHPPMKNAPIAEGPKTGLAISWQAARPLRPTTYPGMTLLSRQSGRASAEEHLEDTPL